LRDRDCVWALGRLAKARKAWVRPLEEWTAEGKGAMTLFRSLCSHLLARYPMPSLVWRTMFANDATFAKLGPVIVHVAAGGSLYKLVQDGTLSIPLTRAMCHDALSVRDDVNLLGAMRRAQVGALGGNDRLWKIWLGTTPGASILERADEEFWLTVLRFLAHNPMFDAAQIEPLIDYIRVRRTEEPGFSMKGRSALALLRAMEDWHRGLAQVKVVGARVFRPSGLHPKTYDVSRVGTSREDTWRVFEILSAQALAEEGRAMHHCVYSYARSIESGSCSIWSVTKEDENGNWRMLTVEVASRARQIVQARGVCNRPADGTSYKVLVRWANDNALTISASV
jgi:hypothetical protein